MTVYCWSVICNHPHCLCCCRLHSPLEPRDPLSDHYRKRCRIACTFVKSGAQPAPYRIWTSPVAAWSLLRYKEEELKVSCHIPRLRVIGYWSRISCSVPTKAFVAVDRRQHLSIVEFLWQFRSLFACLRLSVKYCFLKATVLLAKPLPLVALRLCDCRRLEKSWYIGRSITQTFFLGSGMSRLCPPCHCLLNSSRPRRLQWFPSCLQQSRCGFDQNWRNDFFLTAIVSYITMQRTSRHDHILWWSVSTTSKQQESLRLRLLFWGSLWVCGCLFSLLKLLWAGSGVWKVANSPFRSQFLYKFCIKCCFLTHQEW